MMRVLIADDHEVTRRGVQGLLEEEFGPLTVVEAPDYPGALAAAEQGGWDLILLDVLMPGGTLVDALSRLRAFDQHVPVLVLTAAPELEYIVQGIQAGANGVVHKHHAADELLDAVRAVLDGNIYLHPDAAAAIAGELRDPRRAPHEALSGRELEIFRLIAVGQTVKEIAAALNLSDKTVATYLARIRDKTGLTTHVAIARYALKHGLVE